MALSAKMLKFVATYDGNGTAAARAAGYKGNEATLATQAHRLLKNAEIDAAIKKRSKDEAKATILTRQQRQTLWTKVALDEQQKMSDRLRASELLGKSEADFTEKLEVRGELTLRELVAEARESAVVPKVAAPVVPAASIEPKDDA